MAVVYQLLDFEAKFDPKEQEAGPLRQASVLLLRACLALNHSPDLELSPDDLVAAVLANGVHPWRVERDAADLVRGLEFIERFVSALNDTNRALRERGADLPEDDPTRLRVFVRKIRAHFKPTS